MDTNFVVNPDALRQFEGSGKAFYLVTDAVIAQRCTLAESRYDISEIVAVRGGATVGDLVDELPDGSAVLIAAPGSFVRGEDLARLGERRVAVMPCGSTPVRPEHVGYFLGVLERTDPVAQAERADAFFTAVAAAGGLRLVDDGQRTECAFSPAADDYVWNQQAGVLEPGEQQIAPAGELSVLPMDITDFDPSRRLALDGTLTLRGEPIVHAGYDPGLAGEQADLYERLTALRRYPVVLDVADGMITSCRPGSAAAPSVRVAATLTDLLAADPRYRTVWELGFGINTAMSVVAGNCGMNEVYGADNGVVHLGIGLTPFTRFALTFLCPATRLTDGAGATLLGPARARPDAAPSRVRRTREASCGCH
jgi:hypothetical protein